jgi:regulator of protease activity HflC (stomatin/prohibitin superfamily)
MNTKKIITIAGVALFGLLTTACMDKVPAGNVGVRAYLLGGDKGVDSETLGPGRYWIGWNEELYLFPTFTQNVTWAGPQKVASGENEGWTPDERIVFQDKDGLKIAAGVSMTYSVNPRMAANLFQKYRRGIDEITDPYIKNLVRGALVAEASRLPVDGIYGEGKESLILRVQNRVAKQTAPFGLNIERIEWVGDMALPKVVQDALNQKIEATQQAGRRENMVRTAEAQAAIEKAQAEGAAQAQLIRAKATAEANRVIAQSLTSELIEMRKVEKWNGVQPQTIAGSNGILIR